ncbi:hypothetical protein E5288_WYG016371 [Bos mutus]|uniref:Uncharacterized protein n=1 Tax=Bos mutus TaxID=72004 RepID=A0A6B0R6H7_9CETA|nr:hypothetical protein [Bos mutus]
MCGAAYGDPVLVTCEGGVDLESSVPKTAEDMLEVYSSKPHWADTVYDENEKKPVNRSEKSWDSESGGRISGSFL